MGALDVLALAVVTLVAVVLILEAGHFVARTIHARNAVKRQMDLAREVRDALARTSAIVPREVPSRMVEVVVEQPAELVVEQPAAEIIGLAEPTPVEEATPPDYLRQREAPASEGASPMYFPLTEPQRRLLQKLSEGRWSASLGDRLGTEVMLEWLATLGFVEHREGEIDYKITSLGRRIVEGMPRR